MVNVAGLNQTMKYIEAHPEKWDQRNWGIQKIDCGTAYCFAGTWAALNGGKFPFHPDLVRMEGVATVYEVEIDGVRHNIPNWAADSLDLDSVNSDILFRSRNSLSDLQEMVRLLTDGEDLEDHYPEYDWYGYDDDEYEMSDDDD